MASDKYRQTIEERMKEQKRLVISYYAEIPIYKHAAAFAGISKDTLEDWRKADPKFSAELEKAKAEFTRKHGRRSKPEFLLERLDREHFIDSKKIEVGFDPAKRLLKEFGLLEGGDGREDDGDVSSAPQSTPQDTD